MVAGEFFDFLADENICVKLLGGAFEAGREVHAVAQHGELHALGMADVADDDFAVIDTDADGQLLAVRILLPIGV